MMDDLVLIAKVIVEIARADVDLIGNMAGGNVGFAVVVKERETDLEDALPGARGAGRRWC